jgi:hypothetical protein
VPEAVVRLTRVAAPLQDRLRPYRIELDGKIVGKIRSGDRTEFAVEPGHHRLRIRSSWTGSQALSFEVKKGAVARFECQPNGHSPTALVEVFKSIGRHGDPWIDLREVTGEDIEGT